jgi:hypothetical protein
MTDERLVKLAIWMRLNDIHGELLYSDPNTSRRRHPYRWKLSSDSGQTFTHYFGSFEELEARIKLAISWRKDNGWASMFATTEELLHAQRP